MDDSVTTPLKKNDLLFDTSLTEATSLLTISSSDSGLTTPKSQCEGDWKAFYERVKRTPPKATREANYSETLTKANELLRKTESEEFQNKCFDDLNDDQQSVMIFMILKGMHEVFITRSMAAKVLVKALSPNTKEHKRMLSFVRRGGDRPIPIASKMARSFQSFVGKYPEWKAKTALNIFNKNPRLIPFIHLQNEESYLCTYAACSAMLFYSWDNHQRNLGKLDDKYRTCLKTNVSRYVRDEVSGEQIANFTLVDTKGAYLDKVLLALIQSFGTDSCQDIEKVSTWGDDENKNYRQLEMYLDSGRPMVFELEVLPGFADYRKHAFSGRVSNYLNGSVRPDYPKDRAYHALICVGIKPRNNKIPPMLLVQDSSHRRPFFSIGLDLLMDMGIDDLKFYAVPQKWRFNDQENLDYVVKPETKSLLCGSPMSVDDSGIPCVLTTRKETAIERIDMSRYLHPHDPKIGPFVYEI